MKDEKKIQPDLEIVDGNKLQKESPAARTERMTKEQVALRKQHDEKQMKKLEQLPLSTKRKTH